MSFNVGSWADGSLNDIYEFFVLLEDLDFDSVAGCCDDFIDMACKCILEGCFTFDEFKTLIQLFQDDFDNNTLAIDLFTIVAMFETYFGLNGNGEFFANLDNVAPPMAGMLLADFVGALSAMWVG